MNQTEGQEQVCPACHRGIWEYRWKEEYLEPYTRLQEKYLVGAILEEDSESKCYLGYDLILEQKLLIYEYDIATWKNWREKEASMLFGKFSLPGFVAVKDYFTEYEKGYMVAFYPEEITLKEYLREKGRLSEEDAVQLILPAIHALTELHAEGMIHGNLTPEHFILTSDHQGQILPNCKKYMEEEEITEYTAPEQQEKEGILGPWTDIYAIAAIWYELVTGRKVESVSHRRQKDRLKKPSRYVEVGEKTEKAWMQALALDPQIRFFYFGNLLEKIGLPKEQEEQRFSTIRHIWGEVWLEVAQKANEQGGDGRKRYLIKRLVAAGITIVCLAGILSGGAYVYVQTHQQEYFAWKLKQETKKADTSYITGIYEKTDPDYEEIKKFILKYGKKEEKGHYKIEETYFKKCPAGKGTSKSFYLDCDTAKRAVQYYMNVHKKMDKKDSSNYMYASIVDEKKETIRIEARKTEEYSIRGTKEKVSFSSDPLDNKLLGIEYQGSLKRCTSFLKDMLPLLTPDHLLKPQEIQEVMETELEEEEEAYLQLNAKYRITIAHENDWKEDDLKIYSVKVNPEYFDYNEWSEAYWKLDRDKTSYAGNYERDSRQYQEFISYVEKHAIAKEKKETENPRKLESNGSICYTLTEEDVLKWGEPCNNFRFFQKDKEVLRQLKKKGYQMEKVSEDRENTVEIQKYGGILTRFDVVEHYRMHDGVYLAILKDLVNQDVMQLLVYREEGTDTSIIREAIDVSEITGDWNQEERGTLEEELIKAQQAAVLQKETQFINIKNLIFMSTEYKNTGIGIHIIPSVKFSGQSSYWP